MMNALRHLFQSKRPAVLDVPENSKKQEKLERKYGLESGGAKRDDGEVHAGWAVTRGRRHYNEDNVFCQFLPIPDGSKEGGTREVACLGVFDGHGGAAASGFVRTHLFANLLKHATFRTDLFKAVEEAYVETDQAYLLQDEVHRNDDGCTATTAVLVGRRLVLAHVGDSRAVLGEGGVATPLTEDHKPNRPDERQRIEGVGGTVVHAGTWRVGGVLAVSRSFGNRMLKQYIVPLPEIREDLVSPTTDSLILATDGVWDVVSNLEAVQLVAKYADAEEAARALAALAYDRGSYDNISAVVCLFRFVGGGGGRAAARAPTPQPAAAAAPADGTAGGLRAVAAAAEAANAAGNGGPAKPAVAASDTARIHQR